MCLSANTKAIKQMYEIGLNESHILLCIHKDTDRLNIHEKIKQSYMFLTRCMFIENDPIAPGIDHKNRCYIWEKLTASQPKNGFVDDALEEDNDDINFIENDFYAGKAKKKLA